MRKLIAIGAVCLASVVLSACSSLTDPVVDFGGDRLKAYCAEADPDVREVLRKKLFDASDGVEVEVRCPGETPAAEPSENETEVSLGKSRGDGGSAVVERSRLVLGSVAGAGAGVDVGGKDRGRALGLGLRGERDHDRDADKGRRSDFRPDLEPDLARLERSLDEFRAEPERRRPLTG